MQSTPFIHFRCSFKRDWKEAYGYARKLLKESRWSAVGHRFMLQTRCITVSLWCYCACNGESTANEIFQYFFSPVNLGRLLQIEWTALACSWVGIKKKYKFCKHWFDITVYWYPYMPLYKPEAQVNTVAQNLRYNLNVLFVNLPLVFSCSSAHICISVQCLSWWVESTLNAVNLTVKRKQKKKLKILCLGLFDFFVWCVVY